MCKEGKIATMIGGTIVGCEEKSCAYYKDERCIAERIKMVLVMDENLGLDNLVCDTYDHRDSWLPFDDGDIEEDPFEDENYATDMFGDIV